MPSYAHKTLLEAVRQIDAAPDEESAFQAWLSGETHLELLQCNAADEELIVYVSSDASFVHSLVVPNALLAPPDKDDLLRWSTNPFRSVASYVTGGGRSDMWIERDTRHSGSKTLDAGRDLIFERSFRGWSGEDRTYFELAQEYSHLAEIHWRPEHSAYCRYDENGDLDPMVSVTTRAKVDTDLVSFDWAPLEQYLAVSDSALVRLFHFTLLRRGSFHGWPDGPEVLVSETPDLFFRRKVTPTAAYIRGVQIVRGRRPNAEVIANTQDGWTGRRAREHVEFLAEDRRNRHLARISTAPGATTNYFEAHENDLPFELSPAYFRPEVLSKYKTDRDKYTIGERTVECRSAWSLRGYDVNEAGQVHAYICDLRALPHAEQLHWLSFNEAPKTGLSRRAIENDLKGRFVSFQPPLQVVLSIATRWGDAKHDWWTLRDRALLEQVTAPLTASSYEWSEAFMDLSKLLAEGFVVKALRARLDAAGTEYLSADGSIVLLEKLLGARQGGVQVRLHGLRTVQRIRSKVRGHAGSSEAKAIEQEAIAEHGTLAAHFAHVCETVAAELESLERHL